MGYRVIYSTGKRVHPKRSSAAALTGLCFLLFLILVAAVWPEGWEVVCKGNHAAVDALETFAGQLRSGEEFSGAFQDFWKRMTNALS